MKRECLVMALTWFRIAVIPVVIVLWQLNVENVFGWLFLLFTLAAVTDFFDGYLARAWNCVTAKGAMLDQIADKLLVITMLIILLYSETVPAVVAVIIILREVFVSGLRESLALQSVPLPVSKSGKWKTALQMLAIALVTLGVYLGSWPVVLGGHVFLMLAALLAVVSAILYFRASWKLIS